MEHRALSNVRTKYDALTQISAIKTTQNDFKWHTDNTIFWKLPDATHFQSLSTRLCSVHACRSAQRAINNIYRSLGVPRQREYVCHEYAKYLSTIYGRRHIGGSSITHSRLTPLPKEPSRISLIYLIFLETRIIHLHFPADSLCLSSFNFFLMNPATSRKTFIFLKEGRFGRSRSSKVDKFSANRKRGYDFLLVLNSNLGPILHREIWQVLCASDPTPIQP